MAISGGFFLGLPLGSLSPKNIHPSHNQHFTKDWYILQVYALLSGRTAKPLILQDLVLEVC